MHTERLDELRGLILLNKVPALLRQMTEDDRTVHLATVYRWAAPGGCQGVRLRTVRIGTRMYTSREWLAEFLGMLNGSDAPASPPAAPTAAPPTRPTRADREADRRLDGYLGPKGTGRKAVAAAR